MKRYGNAVLPLAFESYGRLGVASRRTLETLAARAGTAAGDAYALPNLVPRWIAELQRSVIFAIADLDLLALGAFVDSAVAAVQRGCTSTVVQL